MKRQFNLILLFIFSLISFAQDYNTIITDDESEKAMLIGYSTREAFNDTNFSDWWNEEYDIYEVDVETTEEIKPGFEDLEIKLVMGTWCSDSRREVPRFYKILDEMEYPSENISLINVGTKLISNPSTSSASPTFSLFTFIKLIFSEGYSISSSIL